MIVTFSAYSETSVMAASPARTSVVRAMPVSATASGRPAASTPPNTMAITTSATGRDSASARCASRSASSATSSSSSSSPPTSTARRVDRPQPVLDVVDRRPVGLLGEATADHHRHRRRASVVAGHGEHRVHAVDAPQALDDVRRDGRGLDDGHDLATARVDVGEPFVHAGRLEVLRPGEVGVQRPEQGAGDAEADHQDDQPEDDRAPGGAGGS